MVCVCVPVLQSDLVFLIYCLTLSKKALILHNKNMKQRKKNIQYFIIKRLLPIITQILFITISLESFLILARVFFVVSTPPSFVLEKNPSLYGKKNLFPLDL